MTCTFWDLPDGETSVYGLHCYYMADRLTVCKHFFFRRVTVVNVYTLDLPELKVSKAGIAWTYLWYLNPRTRIPEASMLTTRPPKPSWSSFTQSSSARNSENLVPKRREGWGRLMGMLFCLRVAQDVQVRKGERWGRTARRVSLNFKNREQCSSCGGCSGWGPAFECAVNRRGGRTTENGRPPNRYGRSAYEKNLCETGPKRMCTMCGNFWAQNNVTTFPHAPYSPDLAPCDFFLFPKPKTPPQRTSFWDSWKRPGSCDEGSEQHLKWRLPPLLWRV